MEEKSQIKDKKKYIDIIPMCFVSWFVWYMIDDPFMAFFLFIIGFWLAIPLLIWAIVVFLMSFWKKGRFWTIISIWGCAIIILIGAFFISPTRFGTVCNPDIMAKHYEKNKTGMLELIDYTYQSIDSGAQMHIEFDHNKIPIFHVKGKKDSVWSVNWHVQLEEIPTLMQKVGMNSEELIRIKSKLEKIGCISIETTGSPSDYSIVGFRRVALGMYSYRIYNRPLNEEEKKEYNEDMMFIPYSDKVIFEYGGGAIGPQSFGEERDVFMKNHTVL